MGGASDLAQVRVWALGQAVGFESGWPLSSYVTLGRSLNLSVPQFPNLENGANNSPTPGRNNRALGWVPAMFRG